MSDNKDSIIVLQKSLIAALEGRAENLQKQNDIQKQLIELLQKLTEKQALLIASPAPQCLHENTLPRITHVQCNICGAILTDSGWGIAKHMWFASLHHAAFYRNYGRLPE